MSGFTTKITLAKHSPRKKDGRCPVTLRLTISKIPYYYSIPGYYFTEEEYSEIMEGVPKGPRGKFLLSKDQRKNTKLELQAEEKRGRDLLSAMEQPNFQQFKRLFFQKGGGGNVEKYYLSYIDRLKKDQKKFGTASSYECSLNSLKTVKGLSGAGFKAITPAWLKDYEQKMRGEGRTISTIGVYLRPLRCLYNQAIRDGVVSTDHYPFGKPQNGKYKIPSSENTKRPLQRSELEALANFSGSEQAERYRDFFLLSYFLMGLNFFDLLTLEAEKCTDKTVSFVRTKTRDTGREKVKTITLALNEEARAIIERYSTGGKYLFDVIGEKDPPQVVRQKVQNFTRNTNQALKAIAKGINSAGQKTIINQKISTVFARHSAASHAIKSGATLAIVSKSLGHSNIGVTSNYIDSLQDDEIALANSLSLKTAVPKPERKENAA